jgi:hypothetical protein
MKKYEYGRIGVLEQNLEKAGIAPEIIEQIMAGGDTIRKGDTPAKKAAWLRDAMFRMDRLLDSDTRHAVRENCACSLGGQRLKTVKAIAKNFTTFEERVQAANEARGVFGHSVTVQNDGKILVSFAPEGQPGYRCYCLPKAEKPLSITYCYCCGGHVKHHLQIALGSELELKVRSSALSSGGKRPCSFLFTRKD